MEQQTEKKELDISVIIVNYNVKHFVEQCLYSVLKAINGLNAEIIVVDNNSVDGSVGVIKNKFPSVKLIENRANVGFSKANNQAIKIAKGDYILLLNPDTVVQEDSFSKCINFFNENPDAGALGVKMIDGKGNFLPESKRALPTPKVSFFRITGLSSLFPRSKVFARYHLGNLDKDENHEVDILSGAFMMIRKEVIDKVGLLDETFFMYGEDIDFSWRIKKAGYKNYYFSDTTIIHYKGESTKKSSVNYVVVFYKAMDIFAKKHFSTGNARLFSFLISLAIWFRASVAIISRFVKKILPIAVDGIVFFFSYKLIVPWWEQYHFNTPNFYPSDLFYLIIPAYIFIWILSVYYSGGYDSPKRLSKSIRGILIGGVVILVCYALLPDELRFSRALIFFGMILGGGLTILFKWLLSFSGSDVFKLKSRKPKRIVVVGKKEDSVRIKEILSLSNFNAKIVGVVSPEKNDDELAYIGSIEDIMDIVKINNIDEVIFSSKEVSTQLIIKKMLMLSSVGVDFKIAPPESYSVIGSNSINTAGELYSIHLNNIVSSDSKRKKRFFDIVSSIVVLLISPIIFLFNRNVSKLLVNIFLVMFGFKTWVSYANGGNNHLPKIKKGILNPLDISQIRTITTDYIEKSNLKYAQNYSIYTDFLILVNNLNKLSR